MNDLRIARTRRPMKPTPEHYVDRAALKAWRDRITAATPAELPELLRKARHTSEWTADRWQRDFEDGRRWALQEVDWWERTAQPATCAVCGCAFEWISSPRPGCCGLKEAPAACLKCLPGRLRAEAVEEAVAWFRKDNPLARHYLSKRGAPPRPAQYAAVQQWIEADSESLGLVLCGDSFSGKTTAAYHLLQSWLEKYPGETVLTVNATELNGIPDRVRHGDLDEFMESLYAPGILLVDDLDKVRITPRVASELWSLVENRLRREQSPLFITMNLRSRKAFIRLFAGKEADSAKVGESIYNRIAESMQFVDFDAPGPTA